MTSVDEAFWVVRRRDFLPDDVKDRANLDMPLPIGFGQTNSQPTTVKLMLEWLDPRPGDKVLDVGSGSGWTSALLSSIVGPKGKVYAVEKISELVEFGRDNCRRIGLKNVHFYEAGKELGLSNFAPYDRILVSASAGKLPETLIHQLKVGGSMVVPVINSVLIIDKTSSDKYG